MDTSYGVLLLWDVEILTSKGYQLVAESITYADAIRRFGDETELRLWSAKKK